MNVSAELWSNLTIKLGGPLCTTLSLVIFKMKVKILKIRVTVFSSSLYHRRFRNKNNTFVANDKTRLRLTRKENRRRVHKETRESDTPQGLTMYWLYIFSGFPATYYRQCAASAITNNRECNLFRHRSLPRFPLFKHGLHLFTWRRRCTAPSI